MICWVTICVNFFSFAYSHTFSEVISSLLICLPFLFNNYCCDARGTSLPVFQNKPCFTSVKLLTMCLSYFLPAPISLTETKKWRLFFPLICLVLFHITLVSEHIINRSGSLDVFIVLSNSCNWYKKLVLFSCRETVCTVLLFFCPLVKASFTEWPGTSNGRWL